MYQPRGLCAGQMAWPVTGSPDGRAGAVRPTGQPRDLAQRNEASIRLGALPNTVQGYLTTHHAHTYIINYTHLGMRNGPKINGLSAVANKDSPPYKWSGVEWTKLTLHR